MVSRDALTMQQQFCMVCVMRQVHGQPLETQLACTRFLHSLWMQTPQLRCTDFTSQIARWDNSECHEISERTIQARQYLIRNDSSLDGDDDILYDSLIGAQKRKLAQHKSLQLILNKSFWQTSQQLGNGRQMLGQELTTSLRAASLEMEAGGD